MLAITLSMCSCSRLMLRQIAIYSTIYMVHHLTRHALSLFCVSLIGCMSSFRANAQIGEPRSDILIGVSGGVAMNSVGFDPTIKQNLHVAPTLGLTARFMSEKYFSMVCALQVEINYTALGWKENVLDANSEPLPDTYSRHLHYIQLPLLARLGWGREERGFMGYFIAGPQLGYCFSEKSSSSQFTLNAEGMPDRPNGLYAQYAMAIDRRFDYGITGGLGIELSTRIGHFDLEGRYYYGLGDIYNNSKADVFARSNHSTIIVKLAYLFSVKRKNKR